MSFSCVSDVSRLSSNHKDKRRYSIVTQHTDARGLVTHRNVYMKYIVLNE